MTIATRHPAVLIVEDERIVARDLQETLAALGYDAFAIATSGHEAIGHAAARCPDIVLMDIRIRGDADGIATAAVLRERFGVPVVFLTAHADDATLDRAKRTEPYGYLLKPVKAAELRSAIEVALYRHAMEKRLRERERWYSTTLSSIADAVITVDLAGNVTFMNPPAEALTGVPHARALGRPAHEIVPLSALIGQLGVPPVPDPGSPLDHALHQRTEHHAREATLARPDGVDRVISESAAPVIDRDELLGAVMVFRDITDHKQLQRRLEIADRLASLGTMAAGVAHEINNPLSVVVANTTLVLQELARMHAAHPGDEMLADAVAAQQDVEDAAFRIARIVADLRTFSRPEPAASGDADVARAVEWAVRSTTAELRRHATLELAVDRVPAVPLDETRLGQILINLLINAAQAIPPGHAERNVVAISAHLVDGRVVIAIRDTGAGMSPEVQARMFEPFFTTKPVGVGTGLGLAICHGIVSSAGGAISCESQVGVGTTFRISLPCAVPSTPTPPAPAVAPRAATARGRILIIDDEPIVLKTIARVLRDHDVTALGDAREALALLRQGAHFDLILSDLTMPELTGMELYEQLLIERPDAARRIVFLSGGAVTAKVGAFLAVVPNPSISKPVAAPELRELVARLLANPPPPPPAA